MKDRPRLYVLPDDPIPADWLADLKYLTPSRESARQRYRKAILALDEEVSIDGRCHFCKRIVIDDDHGPGCVVTLAEGDDP